MHGLKAQKRLAQGKRSDTLGYELPQNWRPVRAKAFYIGKIRLLPLQGVTNERALTQGVASLALG